MHLRSQKYSLPGIQFLFSQPWLKRLLLYSTVLLFVAMADAVMTYFSPVYVSEYVANEFVMGLVISTSSMIGIICDILFGEIFTGKPHSFFLVRAMVIAALFALTYIFFPPIVPFFIISMALWGIYYELILFSDFHFIDHALDHPHHSLGWSILKTFTAISYMVGPLIASFLMDKNMKYPLYAALTMLGISAFLFTTFKRSIERRSLTPKPVTHKHNLMHEFRIWHLLIPKLWPVMLFVFILTAMDATFWTVGAVLSEKMADVHPFGGLLVVAYMLPSVFAGYISAFFSPKFGKKRTAFLCGLIGGLVYLCAGMVLPVIPFMLLIFVASTFAGMAIPEIYGAIEDYIERLGHSANALVGLENSVTSLSFVIGPILAGLIATKVGDHLTFSVMGIIMSCVSLLAILVVPRKIHLPQSSLQQLER